MPRYSPSSTPFAARHTDSLQTYLPLLILLLGVILQLSQYLYNRSMWYDEAALSLNIVQRSFSELLRPLDYNQGAPLGFLFLEKALSSLFGHNEYVLRLFPLISGIASLIIFYVLARANLEKIAFLAAIFLFAVSPHIIYYASEVKQYSTDVAIALAIYVASLHILRNEISLNKSLLFGIFFSLAICLSHPAIFVIFGAILYISYTSISSRNWKKLVYILIISSLIIVSFSILYFLSLKYISENKTLVRLWQRSFLPIFPLSLSTVRWIVTKFFDIFSVPAGFELKGVAAFFFLAGCTSLFFRKRDLFFILLLPIFFVLVASSFSKYPFYGRLLLFLVPSIIIFISDGIHELLKSSNRIFIPSLLITVLLFHPVISAAYHTIKPRTREEIKSVLLHIKKNKNERDVLYLHCNAFLPFLFYKDKIGFTEKDYISQTSKPSKCWVNAMGDLNDLSDLQNNVNTGRVWIILSGVPKNEEKIFIAYLKNTGQELEVVRRPRATAYLYKFD